MEDSLRLKQRKENAGFSDLGVQYAPGTESGTANGEISESGVQGALSTDSERVPGWWKELRVQEASGTDSDVMVNGKRLLMRSALGITVGASLEDNIAGFQPMTMETGEFSYPEVVAWLMLLSSVSKCQGMALRAKEYAQRIVVDEEMTRGELWLWFRDAKTYKAFWLRRIGMTEEEYEVLERFGFDRGTGVSPSEGAGVETLEALMISLQKTQDEQRTAEPVPKGHPDGTGKTQMHMVQMELDLRELQKEVDDMSAGADTLEALKQGHYYYAEDDGTLGALKQGAGDSELQKRVDEMRELQTLIDDLRAGDKTLEALSLSHYELQQMVDDNMREMCADGSAGGVGILEEQMNTLQKIGDEMRAGETLEALKQGILNRKQIIGEGTMVLQEYERGEFIKVHTAEIEQDPGGQIIKVHIAKIEQDANKVEGAILISTKNYSRTKIGCQRVNRPWRRGQYVYVCWRRENSLP